MGIEWGVEDGIDAWARQLTPEAFAARTTAFVVTPEPDGLTGNLQGAAGDARFQAWVDQRLDDAPTARGWAGPPAWTVFASDGHLQRRYDDCGCRRIRCVLAVSAELRAIEEPWLVAVMLQKRPPPVSPCAGSPLPRRWYAGWYAEARGRGVAARCAGWLQLRGEHQLVGFPCRPEQLNEARRFQDLLRGHPARRQHPIRTRGAS